MTDPDPYLLEAFSHPGTDVFISSWEDTIFYELLKTQPPVGPFGISNVEYGGAYYTVHLGSVTPAYPGLTSILLGSWIVLGISFVISFVIFRDA